ncbi:hypothetical protein AB0I16_19795 [Streptomyces sp. NPDC050703]|uniref:nSTAND1 domain-containing NTPase n=1 Tax=Streptomyces sp. NPDC050703 TaxID=3157218 RepID=UPI003436191B
MPRGERPLEDDGGELTAFAADLRRLREKAGSPPYRQLARDAHYSSSTLADAAAGRRLPSLPVTLAYVRACGGDTRAWRERWHALSARLAATAAAAAETLGAGDREWRGPYAGLAAFRREDAAWFFGREELTDDLVRRVRSGRFLAVFGASGAGKSSLLRAGLLPRIDDGAPWTTVLFAPGAHPLEECAARLSAVAGGSATALRHELTADPRALHLTVLKALADRPPEAEILLVIDQFEEVFTLCSDAGERTGFITALLTAARAANSRTRVVLGVRADFYARCAHHPDLVEALRDAQLLVGPMTTDELRRAISRPAARAACAVEGALLARVIADATGRATVLPLVSHALRETWRRRRGSTLTLSGYEAAGGIEHALARTAEKVYVGFTPAERDLARALLLRLVAVEEGTDASGRRPARADLYSLHADRAEVEAVLDALARDRLITLDTDTVELTHEALLHAWPRLRRWIDEDRAGLLLHQRLNEAATAWDREHRDPGALYRGARLAAAEESFAAPHSTLTALERDFLTASTAARDRERWAAVLTTRRLRGLTVTLSVLLVVALVSGLIAWDQYRISEGHRREAVAEQRAALSRQLAAQASILLTDESDLASLLAVHAYRVRPTAEATTSLIAAASRPLQQRLTGHKGEVTAVAMGPDSRTVASGGRDGTVRLWNATTGRAGTTLRGHRGAVDAVASSPDGATAASGGRDGTVRLWDTDTGKQRRALPGHRGGVRALAYSPDGHTVATGGGDGTVRLWDTGTGERRRTLRGQRGGVESVAFGPDGRTVASAGDDGTVRLWDPRTGAARTPLDGHRGTVNAVAFSPDGHTVATAGADGTVRLWDPATGKNRVTLTEHRRDAESLAFSPDGRTLVSGGRDGTVRLWDTVSGARRAVLSGEWGAVRSVAYSRDGSTVVTGGGDGAVRLWTVATGKARITVPGPRGTADAVAFSPDGRTVAAGGDDGTVRLRDAATGGTRTTLDGHEGAVRSVAFSPDGRTVASGGSEGTVRLWDTGSGKRRKVLTGHQGDVLSVAFSPDGRTVAGGGREGTVRLWNARTGEQRKALPGHRGGAESVAFSPDGRTVASGGHDGTLRLWNTATGRARGERERTTSPMRSVSFAPDGRTVATGSDDGTVRLWNAHTGRKRAELPGARRSTQAVAFSPDSGTVVSSGRDGTVRLWDADTGLQKAVLPGRAGPVRSLAFSRDGRTVVTGSSDGALRLWNVLLSTDEAISMICKSLSRDLTPRERARYLHDPHQRPPRRACGR